MITLTSEDRSNSEPKLIKYRDAGMNTYTYFWTINGRVVSPYFDHENDAKEWKYGDSTTNAK
jgi:YD repeat-containing protein